MDGRTRDILRRAGYIKEQGHSTINHRLDEAIRKIELTHDLLLEAWSAGEFPKGRAIKSLTDLLGQALDILQSLRGD